MSNILFVQFTSQSDESDAMFPIKLCNSLKRALPVAVAS